MRLLFTPAIGVLNRLRYTTKFFLVGAVTALVACSLLFALYVQIDVRAEMAEREVHGLAVFEDALKALALMQRHRGASAAVLGGDASIAPTRERLAGELDQAMGAVDSAIAGPGRAFALDSAWASIKSHWPALRGGTPNDIVANVKQHTQMIEETMRMLGDIGAAAGLAMDPAVDTSNMLAALLGPLPEMTERLGRMRALGASVLAKGALSADDEKRLYDLQGQIKLVSANLHDKLRRAGAANAALTQRFAQASDDIAGRMAVVDKAVQAQLIEQAFAMKPGEFFSLATAAIDRVYEVNAQAILPATRDALRSRADADRRFLTIQMMVAVAAILFVGYVLGAMYLAIVGSVRELNVGAGQLAGGDYTARVVFSARDELSEVARQFNGMAEQLAGIIRQVKDTSTSLSDAASEMAANASQVADGSERQSEAASSMAAAVEEMTVSIDEINRHAQSASAQSTDSGRLSREGAEVVHRSVEEMERIAASVNQVADVIGALGERSGRISTIVSEIREIADQTNLLALNAAIEAARAGEQGRGFAVVADEVRKLAERTAKATGEITGMVGAIQEGTTRAVGTMEEGVGRVQAGVALTKQAGTSMAQIDAGASQVVVAVEEISAALREQSAASNDIARNVEAIAQMSEQNSAAVRAAARTAELLDAMARSMNTQVARFKV
ncbi:methyl-accepting chemotaxis protein [Denitromonas iodatirespirans]|uniref:Methyl-accepting chemotaxis protein n=1 Tax=Denitromonas iodatirespirans TaxID=2795389 RepID=A0A944DA98_DENI1|nr:methyl-accepting chemotaxis protein [Denitromonas iodatirespirans]MBT0961311.1 methyl-accepting chemotaxis protein [Denitromonas iodatirespirans]